MKKKTFLFGLLYGLLMLFNPGLKAQKVSIFIFPPPPGQWNVEDLWNLTLTNTTSQPLNIFLYGTVTEAKDGLIFEGTSTNFTLTPHFSGRIDPASLQPVNASYANEEYKEMVLMTGSMPDGNYRICITAKDAATEDEVGTYCYDQPITHNSPPQLISPADESEVIDPRPVFLWLPSTPLSIKRSTEYTMKIVELMDGQVPIEAMESNPAFFTEKDIPSTSFQLPISAREFEAGKSYAWQVTAVSSGALKYETGRSQVWSFDYKSEEKHEKKQCEHFKFGLKKTEKGDTTFYNIFISNKYFGQSKELMPASFKLRILTDSVIYSDKDVKKGWKRSDEKKPPDTIDMVWKNKKGSIPEGQSYLGKFYLKNSSFRFKVFSYWYDETRQLLCKDSLTFNKSLMYYTLSNDYPNNYQTISDSLIYIQFNNNYASIKNLFIRIYDVGSRSLVKPLKPREMQFNSLNGLNRIAINASDYGLQPGKPYLLTISDLINLYYFNFKISSEYER
jgi:hypothetical protein